MSDMTRPNAIKQLKRLLPKLQYADDVNAVKVAINSLEIDEQYDLAMEQAETREVVNVLEEIIQYTYGMITEEKFGLQQFLISKLDKYNSELYDGKEEL